MQVVKVDLTKRKLAALPAEERRALLLLGHAVNEITVLQKLMMMVRRDDAAIPVVGIVEAGQILIVMRMLIGKLHEAWEPFKKRVQGEVSLRDKYLANFAEERRALLKKLNRHFGGGSPVTAIRNQLAFHSADQANLVEENFQRIPETEPWHLYLTETVGNTFYYASELVTTASAMRLASPNAATEQEAIAHLFNVTLEATRDITELLQQVIADIVESMGDDIQGESMEIGEVTKMSEFSLPFYFDEADFRKLVK